MALDNQKIRSTIESAIRQTAEGDIPHSSEIAFHMTDWLTELQRFYDFCRDPQRLNTSEIMQLLIDFLVHVPNHVAAASKLLLDVPISDIFEVGAVEIRGEEQDKSKPLP